MRTESAIRCRRGLWDWLAQPTALFGGVYGILVSRGVVRAVLAEWPLVVAALPTTPLLWGGAGLGWWHSTGIEYVAFGINTVLLLGWGLRDPQRADAAPDTVRMGSWTRGKPAEHGPGASACAAG